MYHYWLVWPEVAKKWGINSVETDFGFYLHVTNKKMHEKRVIQ